jgi:hypothetical protein
MLILDLRSALRTNPVCFWAKSSTILWSLTATEIYSSA